MSCINIKRIRLVNYKAFVDETIQCNPNLNIYVGDNGTGKSSIHQAIDLTLSGSSTKVDSLGIENILNAGAGKLNSLSPISRNKFYVACTRASGKLCFIREKDVAEYKTA